MNEIYCDNSATTAVYPEVIQEMEKYFKEDWGNPSSIYAKGRIAKNAIEDARKRIAKILNCKPNEIYFTSGGSESDNIFIKGCFKKDSTIITSEIEHPAVLNACKSLPYGLKLDIPVDTNGVIKLDTLKKLSDLIKNENPIYVTVMLVNNETGVIQPIAELSRFFKRLIPNIIIHTDAVQAVGKTTLNVKKLGVDSMSLSGHKFGAPKGIGILYLKEGIKCKPLIDGGGQEMGLRSGTENVPYIMGIAKALEITNDMFRDKSHRAAMSEFNLKFFRKIQDEIPESWLNGNFFDKVDGIFNFRFDGIDAQNLLLYLDSKGIYVSAGSACHSDSNTPSHVLTAMGLEDEMALSSLRFSFREPISDEEIDYIVQSLKEGIKLQKKYDL